MHISRLDLNLLVVFDAIMKERHVTRASKSLYMSQPAVSNALNRLRHTFKDDLFVRSPEGMKPTPRALELAAPVRAAIAELEQALEPPTFDPATAEWTFRIVGNDYFASVLLPPLVEHIGQHAPRVDLRLLPQLDRSFELLDANAADFAINWGNDVPERFSLCKLIEDEFVCIMRKGHPLAQQPLTLESYAGANHLLVAPTGNESGLFDPYLKSKGLTRRIAVTVNQFSAAPALVAQSDLVVTLLKRIARQYTHLAGLTTMPLPFDQNDNPGYLMWHTRLATHPAHDWFRRTLSEIASRV